MKDLFFYASKPLKSLNRGMPQFFTDYPRTKEIYEVVIPAQAGIHKRVIYFTNWISVSCFHEDKFRRDDSYWVVWTEKYIP